LASSFCAYAVAEYLKSLPIYEALLERDLKRGGIGETQARPIVVDFQVADAAPFAGKLVRELGLPRGCVLVRCHAHGREWVPNANARLEAHMRIIALIAPEADSALETLRRGCSSRLDHARIN
jgi:chloride channel protein, CIC family